MLGPESVQGLSPGPCTCTSLLCDVPRASVGLPCVWFPPGSDVTPSPSMMCVMEPGLPWVRPWCDVFPLIYKMDPSAEPADCQLVFSSIWTCVGLWVVLTNPCRNTVDIGRSHHLDIPSVRTFCCILQTVCTLYSWRSVSMSDDLLCDLSVFYRFACILTVVWQLMRFDSSIGIFLWCVLSV